MSGDAPAISIILTTTGRRTSLAASLASARAQSWTDLEIVVVDDAPVGTVWRTRADLQDGLADPRVRVVRGAGSSGCAAARNVGLRAARGRWICYLDDDNIYRPDKVARQHALALTSGAPMVLCGLTICAAGRRRRRQCDVDTLRGDDLLLRAWADTNVLFHRRDEKVRWPEDLGTMDDACFFQDFVTRHDVNVVPSVPVSLVRYHAHGGARANLGWAGFYRGQRRWLVRYARSYSPSARRVALLRALVAFTKYHDGRWYYWRRYSGALLRVGGLREWRVVANAAAVKTPVLRRWMVR